MVQPPEVTEFHPAYAQYVGLVPSGDIRGTLSAERDTTVALLRDCPPQREEFRYAPEKWSIREVLGHVLDAERMYAYRVFHIGRGNRSALPGVDARGWINASAAHERPLSDLLREFETVRAATLSLFCSLPEPIWLAVGLAAGRPFSVRALAYIIAGHEIHHRRQLEQKYLYGQTTR